MSLTGSGNLQTDDSFIIGSQEQGCQDLWVTAHLLGVEDTYRFVFFVFIEILFKMLLFKGAVLIYAEHCMCVCVCVIIMY